MSPSLRAEHLLHQNTDSSRRVENVVTYYSGPVLYAIGGTTGATYEIHSYLPPRLKGVCGFCVNFGGRYIPDGDRMLAMALYIEHDERHFLKNARPLYVSPRVTLHYARAGIITFSAVIWFVMVANIINLAVLLARAIL